MASLYCSAVSPSPSQFKLGFGRPSCRANHPSIKVLNLQPNLLPTTSSNFRYKNVFKLQLSRRVVSVFTLNATPSEGDALTEKSNRAKTSDGTPKRPPLLTILAGFLVLALVCWIIGSIVIWLFSLIFTVPPSK
ncbi:hypothetical protein LguiB_023898 [Lonicera macranthoides]